MTRVRRRATARRAGVAELTEMMRLRLLHGYDWAIAHFSLADMHNAWELHRTELLSEWIKRHPGSRPFAWWLFDGVPQHGERQLTKYGHRITPYRENWLAFGILHTHTTPPIQESEAEYLQRHGLLTTEEQEALGDVVTAAERFEGQYPELSRELMELLTD